jgi:hypothetical protein
MARSVLSKYILRKYRRKNKSRGIRTENKKKGKQRWTRKGQRNEKERRRDTRKEPKR